MATEILIKGNPSRALPIPQVDNQREGVPFRTKKYGDFLDPIFTKHALADEGCYFTGSMTPSQGALTYGINATFSDTAGFIEIQNTDLTLPTGTGKRIFLDYLKFIISTAPASATAAWMAVKTDNARTPSANSLLITPSNVNMDSGTPSISKLWFPTGGTLTLPAVVAPRLITGNLNLRTTIPVVSDEYFISFGGTDFTQTPGANLPAALATVASMRYTAPPFVVGPGQCGLIYLWFPGNITTGAFFSNIEVGWVER